MVHGSTHGGWLINVTNALANYDGQTGPLPGKILWPATSLLTITTMVACKAGRYHASVLKPGSSPAWPIRPVATACAQVCRSSRVEIMAPAVHSTDVFVAVLAS